MSLRSLNKMHWGEYEASLNNDTDAFIDNMDFPRIQVTLSDFPHLDLVDPMSLEFNDDEEALDKTQEMLAGEDKYSPGFILFLLRWSTS